MKKMHIIWAHPRKDSLTAKIVEAIKKEANNKNFNVTEWEAYSSGFNPVLQTDDEPDWYNTNKQYNAESEALAKELSDKDYLIFIFPIWWYSLPAILKGYIDRVWNYGVFYGDRNIHRLPVKAIRWIGLVGSKEASIQKRDYDKYMDYYFNVGLAEYCGIEDSKVKLIYDTIGRHQINKEDHYNDLIKQAVSFISSLQ
ncbi:NAD(P)H oxidoreductase [Chryseobacterium arthrosphaerae]|uniref:NAD(P)H oxidoreductase n=1 Tax=Chryseobacterium arthrosphaerae TaxID=651561 RepID=A0A432DY82_9FLAO|nr:NAD(P)H oxidoreductase [Chryseobacterium arthrosphaerae]AYZ12799.1 NAD(P)H oxidoreductase [Chryseobacterium arthrosphaerae]MDG4654915.1 NAD(P)H oxidoreductase [Chryseobacterium arthrosphaerae]RTZ49324.1 NAD(P)H oxidoreductase [Chryseobacterium arthrosphaerae]